MSTDLLLETRSLFKTFGGLVAVNHVDMAIHPGQIHALIGPNGAGKTTIFNLVSGTHALDGGEIIFNGQPISRLQTNQIAGLGIVRTFQNLQIFANMTVLENVMVGCHLLGKTGFFQAALRLPAMGAEESRMRNRALELLDLVGLAGRADDQAPSLAFGQQRLVELARALAVEPRLLLLDEPAAGLNRVEAGLLNDLILQIRDMGITVFLVEHDMNLVMGLADHIIVLHYGTKIADGSPDEVQSDPAVINAYLGMEWQKEKSDQSQTSQQEAERELRDA